MRHVFHGLCVMTALVMLCTAGMAQSSLPGCASRCGPYAWDLTSVYGAQACMAPGYGAVGPGCCPCPACTCCDRIWDGYCADRYRHYMHYASRRFVPTTYCGPVAAPGCTGCATGSVSLGPSITTDAVQQPAAGSTQTFEYIAPGQAPTPAPEIQRPAANRVPAGK